jgi:hypothetical protein
MVTLTFTQGANAVSIAASVVFGTDFWDERANQQELETADCTDVVYDNGPTVCHGVIVMKGVSYANGDSLRAWLRTYAIFAYNTFTISAVANLNLGNGVNTAITSARYDKGQSLAGVFEFVAPGVFDITFPFRFTR